MQQTYSQPCRRWHCIDAVTALGDGWTLWPWQGGTLCELPRYASPHTKRHIATEYLSHDTENTFRILPHRQPLLATHRRSLEHVYALSNTGFDTTANAAHWKCDWCRFLGAKNSWLRWQIAAPRRPLITIWLRLNNSPKVNAKKSQIKCNLTRFVCTSMH